MGLSLQGKDDSLTCPEGSEIPIPSVSTRNIIEVLSNSESLSIRCMLWTNALLALQKEKLFTERISPEDVVIDVIELTVEKLYFSSVYDDQEVSDFSGETSGSSSKPLRCSCLPNLQFTPQSIRLMFFTACFSGMRNLTYTEVKSKAPNLSIRQSILPCVVMRDVMKTDGDTVNGSQFIFKYLPVLCDLSHFMFRERHDSNSNTAMEIRERACVFIKESKSLWREAIFLACAVELTEYQHEVDSSVLLQSSAIPQESFSIHSINHPPTMKLTAETVSIISRYQHMEETFVALNLETISQLKPLLDVSNEN